MANLYKNPNNLQIVELSPEEAKLICPEYVCEYCRCEESIPLHRFYVAYYNKLYCPICLSAIKPDLILDDRERERETENMRMIERMMGIKILP